MGFDVPMTPPVTDLVAPAATTAQVAAFRARIMRDAPDLAPMLGLTREEADR